MAFCGKCGQQVNDGVKFCPACGAPMAAAAPTPEAPPQPAAAPQQQYQQPQPVQQPPQAQQPQPAAGDTFSNLNNTAEQRLPVRSQRHRTAQRHVDPSPISTAGSYSDIGGQRLAFCPISFQPGFAALHRIHNIWYSVQHSKRRDPRHLMATLFCGEHHRTSRFRICHTGRDRNSQCRERSRQRAPAYRKISLIKIVFISNNLLYETDYTLWQLLPCSPQPI